MEQTTDNTPLPSDAELGFDPGELLRQMTDGLPQWHHRQHERLLTLRLCTTTMALFALLIPTAYLLAPTDNNHIADGMTYAQVVQLTDNMLCA
jgi:hypothetical protein